MYEHEDCQHCRTVGHFVLYYMPGFEQHQLWTFLFSSAAANKVFRHRFGSSDATVWPRPDIEDPTWRQNLFKIQTAHLPEASLILIPPLQRVEQRKFTPRHFIPSEDAPPLGEPWPWWFGRKMAKCRRCCAFFFGNVARQDCILKYTQFTRCNIWWKNREM